MRAAVDLGHTHGLVVVAEGVEDEPTRRLLVDDGCDVIQGYLVSRPLPPEAFDRWLEQHPDPTGPTRAGATGAGAPA